MNYTITDYSDKVQGTCLQGYVEASYERLHELFGEPIYQPDSDKTSTEWVIEFDDGLIATVYDYKETGTYNLCCPSIDEFRARPSYSWHVGGKSKEVVGRIQNIITARLGAKDGPERGDKS